jgi:CheY-like chemotaxis protein
MAQDWTDTVAEALERLDVADTLEELRHHIDALIHRLAESEARNDAPAADAAEPAAPNPDPALDRQIDSLGKKVEFASDMLAQLTDLLESQNERIETIEQQIGDPDADPRGAAAATADTEISLPVAELKREIAFFGAERERLSERISRLEATVERLDSTVDTVRDLTFQREERVRDLEDRLFVALESRPEQPKPAQQHPPRAMSAGEAPRSSIVAVPELGPAPSPRSDAAFHEPMDPATARRLEDLVEREIKLQHEFSPGAEGTSERTARPGRSTVMVVDDSADARTILSIYLSRTGYQVVTAASAEDCLAKLRHHRVDAVVLDATMPGGGGEHVLRVLASSAVPGQKAPAIIVYTAHPEILGRDKARQLGASDYLVKGGDLLPLLTALVRHLNPTTPAAL